MSTQAPVLIIPAKDKTIGNANDDNTIPIVKKIENSRHDELS